MTAIDGGLGGDRGDRGEVIGEEVEGFRSSENLGASQRGGHEKEVEGCR